MKLSLSHRSSLLVYHTMSAQTRRLPQESFLRDRGGRDDKRRKVFAFSALHPLVRTMSGYSREDVRISSQRRAPGGLQIWAFRAAIHAFCILLWMFGYLSEDVRILSEDVRTSTERCLRSALSGFSGTLTRGLRRPTVATRSLIIHCRR